MKTFSGELKTGTLTSDQEVQIEKLLISTVTKISLMTERMLESLDRYTREWISLD